LGVLIDEDDMSSDSATKVPSQQSVKAYVDAAGGGGQPIPSGAPSTWALGTMAALKNTSGGNVNNGSTVAGSGLNSAGFITPYTNLGTLSGTWTNISGGTQGANTIGYYVRTA